MQVIKPTKKEVFEQMKLEGCTWCGGYGCECHYKINFKTCFDQTEKRLSRTEYTPEEEAELTRKGNEARAELDAFLEELFGDL